MKFLLVQSCAKRKRCYDVTLSRQEGSTTRHLAILLCVSTWVGITFQSLIMSHLQLMTSPFAEPRSRPTGKISVNLLTGDWLCKKLELLENRALVKAYTDGAGRPCQMSKKDATSLLRHGWLHALHYLWHYLHGITYFFSG